MILKDKRTKRRSTENYLGDNIELGNNLIVINAINIKDNVKKTKIEAIIEKSMEEILDILLDEIE